MLMVDLDQTLIHTTEQHCQQMSNKVSMGGRSQWGGCRRPRKEPGCWAQEVIRLCPELVATVGEQWRAGGGWSGPSPTEQRRCSMASVSVSWDLLSPDRSPCWLCRHLWMCLRVSCIMTTVFTGSRAGWAGMGCHSGDCSHLGLVRHGAGHFHSFHKSLNGCITPSVSTCGSKVSPGPRGPCPLLEASLCPPDPPPLLLPDLQDTWRAAPREVG